MSARASLGRLRERGERPLSAPNVTFRSYDVADREACLAIFDANTPVYFVPNERNDYERFLDTARDGYEVCEVAARVVAAFGLLPDDSGGTRLVWIMLDPGSQGSGIGSAIMQRVMASGRASRSPVIKIAASQKSAPFFAKFGATAVLNTQDGWGPGMDRVDMELTL